MGREQVLPIEFAIRECALGSQVVHIETGDQQSLAEIALVEEILSQRFQNIAIVVFFLVRQTRRRLFTAGYAYYSDDGSVESAFS